MEKTKLENFIKKYHLNGIIEGSIWLNESNNLVTYSITDDKKLFANITLDKAADFFTDVDIGIQQTSRLKRMISPFGEKINLSIDVDQKDKTRVRQLILEDENLQTNYISAGKEVITKDGAIPKVKNIPEFTIEIVVSQQFIDIFSKSYSGLNNDQILFTVVMNPKKNKLEMILGYKQRNLSDRTAINLNVVDGKNIVKSPISFSAKHFKEILSANNEVEETTLKISEAGLASIFFSKDDIKSQYYLIKVDVEE